MLQTIIGQQPFQVLATNFSISPSNEGYDLQISSDGFNYSTLFSVGAGVTRMVTGVSNGSYFRLLGNESEVVINWNKQCNGGGGGGEVGPQGPQGPAGADGAQGPQGLNGADGAQGPQGPAGGGESGDFYVLLPSSALPQSVIWTEYESNTFKLIRQVVEGEGQNYIAEWGEGSYVIVGGTGSTLGYGADWTKDGGIYTLIADTDLTSWTDGSKIYFKHNVDTLNFGIFGSSNPKEGGVEVEGDENGSVRATTNGVYQLINDEWKKIETGAGDNHILLASSSTPEELNDGDVFATTGGVFQAIVSSGSTTIKEVGGDSHSLLPIESLPGDYNWVTYADDTFNLVRENIVNDDVYLMHWDSNSHYAGVNCADGIITGSSYSMDLGQDGKWHCNQAGYENITAWDENGKLYWNNPYAVISMLDAYGAGSDPEGAQGDPVPALSAGTVVATTEGLHQVMDNAYIHFVHSADVVKIWKGTQAEYSALGSGITSDTLYIII